ncbi:unnamed protein product [Symbiodinium microadriaticum]|nr:unnamed protein product [Symbiodinium microadriaticum]CAE7333478.1 unnamed protein product [Symbiodinium sp. KB8]
MATCWVHALLLGVFSGILPLLQAVGNEDVDRPGHLWESAWGSNLPEAAQDDPWNNGVPEATHPVHPENAPSTTYEDLVEYMNVAWGNDEDNSQTTPAAHAPLLAYPDASLVNNNNWPAASPSATTGEAAMDTEQRQGVTTSSSATTCEAVIDPEQWRRSIPATHWDEELSTSLQQDEVDNWIADEDAAYFGVAPEPAHVPPPFCTSSSTAGWGDMPSSSSSTGWGDMPSSSSLGSSSGLQTEYHAPQHGWDDVGMRASSSSSSSQAPPALAPDEPRRAHTEVSATSSTVVAVDSSESIPWWEAIRDTRNIRGRNNFVGTDDNTHGSSTASTAKPKCARDPASLLQHNPMRGILRPPRRWSPSQNWESWSTPCTGAASESSTSEDEPGVTQRFGEWRTGRDRWHKPDGSIINRQRERLQQQADHTPLTTIDEDNDLISVQNVGTVDGTAVVEVRNYTGDTFLVKTGHLPQTMPPEPFSDATTTAGVNDSTSSSREEGSQVGSWHQWGDIIFSSTTSSSTTVDLQEEHPPNHGLYPDVHEVNETHTWMMSLTNAERAMLQEGGVPARELDRVEQLLASIDDHDSAERGPEARWALGRLVQRIDEGLDTVEKILQVDQLRLFNWVRNYGDLFPQVLEHHLRVPLQPSETGPSKQVTFTESGLLVVNLSTLSVPDAVASWNLYPHNDHMAWGDLSFVDFLCNQLVEFLVELLMDLYAYTTELVEYDLDLYDVQLVYVGLAGGCAT